MQPTQGIDLVFCYRLRVAGKSRGKMKEMNKGYPQSHTGETENIWSKNICRGLNDPTLGHMTQVKHNGGQLSDSLPCKV